MKIGFASDHAGFEYKDKLIALMKKKGFETVDFGTYSDASCDYPDFAHALGNAIDTKEVDLGVALCGSGNGITMTTPTSSACPHVSFHMRWPPVSSAPGLKPSSRADATSEGSKRYQ